MKKLIALLLLGVGCGGSGGGDAAGTPPAPPVVPVIEPVLTALSVSPAASEVDRDATVALTVQAHWSDGDVTAPNAAWISDAPATVSLSDTHGSAVTATAVGVGTAQVTATYLGLFAIATIESIDAIPVDPGPVYGGAYGTVFEYPSDGGAPFSIHDGDCGDGIALNDAGTLMYVMTYGVILEIDLATGITRPVATLPADPNVRAALSMDSEGFLITHGYGDGVVHRIDPATGDFTTIGALPFGMLGQALDPADEPFFSEIISGGFYRTGVAGVLWALAPAGVTGGICFNRLGEGFSADCMVPVIRKCVDVNGDGDALDDGEETIYATLPGGNSAFGISVARGGTLLVHYQDWSGTGANQGVYWLRDLDGNGIVDGADEVVRYNETTFENGIDPGCIVARR